MSNKCALVSAVLAMTVLSGCASYQPTPLSPADNARALDSRSLDDPRLRQFIVAAQSGNDKPSPPLRWRLATLSLAALYYHPDIKVAQAKLSAAEAAVITAREPPNPVLNLTNIFGSAAVAGAIPAGAAPVTIGPVIDLILETAGKRQARTERAQHLVAAARWDLATAEWQVRANVRNGLLDLWAARERALLTRQRLSLQEQLVQLLEHRLAEGAAAAPDVAQARTDQAQIALTLSTLDRQATEARVKLATAIGIPARGLDGAELDLTGFDHPSLIVAKIEVAEWRHEALIGRSDIQASLAAYEAAQAALQLAIADQFPNVTLSPGYNYDLGVNRYVLNVGATLPVFHQNQGPIAEALAKRQEAADAFTAMQAQIIGAIDEAAAMYTKATQSVAAADAILADERRRAQQVENAFHAGQADRPALLGAQLELAATRLTRFDALVEQRRALGAFEDALHRPLYEPHASLPSPSPELSS